MDIDKHLHHRYITYMITVDDDSEKHSMLNILFDTTEILISTKGLAFVLKDLERFVLEDA